MPTFIDQMKNEVLVPTHPKRIISLVPSQTEFLFDLGLDETIVGITKYCIHPKEKTARFKNTNAIIGGTKKLNIELIRALKPDLIIGNKEENEKTPITQLQKEFPVWMSDIQTLTEAYEMMIGIGILVKKNEQALHLVNRIKEQFNDLQKLNTHPSALYFIWRKPFMAAGEDTFINHLLERCGFKNSLCKKRYPEITPEEIQELQPAYIFLSSEPYPFKQKHITELQSLSPLSKICLVDGEVFSWYGSRLLHFPSYFHSLTSLHLSTPS